MHAASACPGLTMRMRLDSCWADTYLISPSLVLVRSKKAANRETGIWRVHHWHSGAAALPEVVAQGGAEALLATLPSAQPETRLTVLELLIRMVPLGNARASLIANEAVSHATASCTSLRSGGGAAAAAATRCDTLVADLAAALEAKA
jgi:hypothetical protein